VFAVRFARHATGSYVSPVTMFCGLWLSSLSFLYTDLVYYEPLEWSVAFVFLLNVVLFALGGFAASVLMKGKGTQANARGAVQIGARELRALRLAALIVFLVGMAGTVWYYTLLHKLIGIQSLWENPMLVRYEESYGELNRVGLPDLLRACTIPSFILSLIYLQFQYAPTRKFIGIVALIALLTLLPNSGRTTIFNAALWGALAIVYTRKIAQNELHLRKSHIVWAVCLAPLILGYFIVTTTLLNKGFQQGEFGHHSQLPAALAWLADPYFYLTSPLMGFQQMMRAPDIFAGNGNLTFGALSRILSEIAPQIFHYPEYVQPFVSTPTPTNMYTYMDVLFLDFGWFGTIIMPFVIGALTTYAYLWMQRNPSLFKVYLTSLLGLCVLSSTTVYRFGTFGTWLWIVVAFGALSISRYFVAAGALLSPPKEQTNGRRSMALAGVPHRRAL